MSPVSGQGAGRGEGFQDTRQEATQRKTHGMHAKGWELCIILHNICCTVLISEILLFIYLFFCLLLLLDW